MTTPQTEKLRKFYEMIAPHINGHRTASQLFWDTINELETEQLNNPAVSNCMRVKNGAGTYTARARLRPVGICDWCVAQLCITVRSLTSVRD